MGSEQRQCLVFWCAALHSFVPPIQGGTKMCLSHQTVSPWVPDALLVTAPKLPSWEPLVLNKQQLRFKNTKLHYYSPAEAEFSYPEHWGDGKISLTSFSLASAPACPCLFQAAPVLRDLCTPNPLLVLTHKALQTHLFPKASPLWMALSVWYYCALLTLQGKSSALAESAAPRKASWTWTVRHYPWATLTKENCQQEFLL